MNRTGLMIALAIAAVVGVVFGLFPELDLRLARIFYEGNHGGWLTIRPWSGTVRNLASGVIALIAAPAFIALVLKVLRPRRPLFMPGRAIVLMISTLALAPGLVANTILKDHWGRPRPFFVQDFGGTAQFMPWWDPRGSCQKNCSFIGGEPAGAFWTLAPAAVTPPAWRAVAYGGALAFGAAVGLMRMAGGAHFFSDVVFAGVITFLVIWLVHGLIYRWRPTRVNDAGIERLLERVVTPAHDAVARVAARLRGVPPQG